MQLTIDKLVYGGDGLAHGPADEHGQGKAVFLPFVLAGEQVEAEIVEQKPGFLRARPGKVLRAASERVTPRCPYFGECGGCHYQHADYDNQLRIKTAILNETLRRIGRIDVPDIAAHPSPPWNYRNRTRMKVRGGGDFALGYFRISSHDLLPVEQCPISSPLINRAIDTVWQLGRSHMISETVVEMEFFANAADSEMLLELTLPDRYWTRPSKPSLAEFIGELRRLLPEIVGVAPFRSTPEGTVVREEVPKKLRGIFGADELIYETGSCAYHVSAGSFFQTNRFLIPVLTELVAGHSGDAALDLYAGTGLFTLPLAQKFREVTAVEPVHFSFHDLRRNAPANVKTCRESTEDFLRHVRGQSTNPYDLVVVDPPRGGMGAKTTTEMSCLPASHVTYVSCDPATLARDLKILLAAGFRIERMHLVDLFPQTFHIESVTQLAR